MSKATSTLVRKAVSLGLVCQEECENTCISPGSGNAVWCLTYRNGLWVLQVRGVPQINFSSAEAIRFLDRVASRSAKAGHGVPQHVAGE
ncbi:MAG TPA: hypothetical protein V6D06_03555 [Trichocoleus sp.]